MKKLFVVLMAVIMISMGIISSADAVPVLTLDDGVTSISITDNMAGDMNSAEGAITFAGSIGSFIVNVSSGVSYPVAGSSTLPVLDLINQAVSSSSSGSLRVTFTQDGFGPVAASSLMSSVTGGFISGSGTIDIETLINGAVVSTMGPFSGTTFTDTVSASISAATPFSIGLVANIHHNGAATSSLDTGVAVPEPGTLAMFGSGLVGLYYVRRSKTFKL